MLNCGVKHKLDMIITVRMLLSTNERRAEKFRPCFLRYRCCAVINYLTVLSRFQSASNIFHPKPTTRSFFFSLSTFLLLFGITCHLKTTTPVIKTAVAAKTSLRHRILLRYVKCFAIIPCCSNYPKQVKCKSLAWLE